MPDPPPDPEDPLPPVPDPETIPAEVGQRAWLPSDTPRAGLLVIQGRTTGRLYALLTDDTVLGRAIDAGIVLDDAGVSRRHARIQRRIDEFVLYDLDSRNGVFVNADPVKERVLQDGDRVQLGTGTVLKFRLHDPEEEEAQRRLYESATRDLLTEEFAVVLRHAGRTEARKAAERIRKRVEGLRVTFEGMPLSLTVSVGVATLAPKGGPQALLAAADAALYRAKREGRNRVAVAGG